MCILPKLKLKMLQTILGHRLTAYSLYNVAFHCLQCNLTSLHKFICKYSIAGLALIDFYLFFPVTKNILLIFGPYIQSPNPQF